MMKEWQVLQSPIFMALLAATTCSLMLSGGPGQGETKWRYGLLCVRGSRAAVSAGTGGPTQERLPLSHPELVMELLADHPATGVKLVRGHVGDLQQHRGHQVHALQQLQVDVHVEGHLPGSGGRSNFVGFKG